MAEQSEIESFESIGLVPWIVRQTKSLGKFHHYFLYFNILSTDFWFSSVGLKHPTPVQQNCIPKILAGEDCIGAAKTG